MNEERAANNIQDENIDEENFQEENEADFNEENEDDFDWDDDYNDDEYDKTYDDMRDSVCEFKDYLEFLEKSLKVMDLRHLEQHWSQIFPNGMSLFRFLQEMELVSDSIMELKDEISDSEDI